MKSGRRLRDYRHKVRLEEAASPPAGDDPSFASWFAGLPRILAGGDLPLIVERWTAARRRGRPAIWGFGAHVVKVGLSPWVIRLMEEGLVTHLAVNGAVAIHDYELAAVGHTSEEVSEALAAGVFGRAEETFRFFNGAARAGMEKGTGLGESLGAAMLAADLPHKEASLLAAAARLGIPVSVHLAIGTDTVHAHPEADGRALGQTSLEDFRRLSTAVAGLGGGIYFNIGSAVILPEVFLKAVSLARASGADLAGMTTVVMDFNRHYRPLENVARRPVGEEGRGFYLVGHHEIMVPLLAQAALLRRARGG